MRQRLAAQFGLSLAAMTVVAGVALADSTTPGSNSANSSQTSITFQGDSSLSVQSTQVSSQQVGVSGPTNGGSGNASGGLAPKTGSTSTSLSDNVASNTTVVPVSSVTIITHGTNQPPASTGDQPNAASSTTPSTPAGVAPSSQASAPQAGPAKVLSATVVAAVARAADLGAPANSSITPVPAPSAAPHSTTPPPPASPAGLLDELHALLSSTVIPAILALGSLPIPAMIALAALIALGILLALVFSRHIPVNSYTARLRRSGFLGAARSDVGGAGFFFATPLEMSCIGAPAP